MRGDSEQPGHLALRGTRVLVTGAGGFIGGQLCRRLALLGAIVHGTFRRPTPNVDPKLTAHTLDVSDPAGVERLIADVAPSYVFHLASRVSGSRAIDEVDATFRCNLQSTVNLLTALAKVDSLRRFVLAGSLEQTESRDAAPSSPYAASKTAAAMYARMFHELYGLPITIARIFMVYGPGQRDARKLVPYVATSLLSGHSPNLTSGVRPVDWVYIDDVVEALIRCATEARLNGQTVDIGTGALTTVRRVAEQIAKLVGRGEPVFGAVEDRTDEQVRSANVSQTRELLGREPIPLEEGLSATVAWYRDRVQ